jgi:hypothetical protein
LSGIVVVALGAAGLTLSTTGVAQAACAAGSRADARAATALAKACGKPVLVEAERTENTTVVANADGSFTDTEWDDPHYVRMIDGTWRTVDTTLQPQADGSYGPVASPNPVSLSGGGNAVLARQVSNQKELVWTWPLGALPAPTLAGDTATYPDVLPDVDLVVKVDVYGFSDVFVVKTAAAAADPRLAQITFGLSGNGMSAAGLAGTATTIDAAVDEDFTIGDAYMWDSTLPTTAPDPDAPPEDADTVSDAGGPGSGAQQAVVPTRVDGHTFVLVPDAALLTSATTVFPLFIDPKSSAPIRSSWTMINSGHTSQSYWSYDRADHAKVGNAGDGTNMYRSLFQFSTSTWKGKHVTAAEFHVGLKHSWSCSNTSTEIHVSSSATIGSGTTWSSNSSTWGSSLDTASNQNCHDASGVDTEWSSSALTSGVAAKASAATVVIGLRAANESAAASGWKKFDESTGAGGAHLSVTYNTAPKAGTLLLDGTTCKTSASSPALLSTIGSHNPVPKVSVTDGEADKSTVTFTYPKAGGGTATSAMANVASGATAQLTAGIPAAGIPSGSTVYSWKATISDGTDSSTAGPCYFRIDNTIPAPPVVASADNLYVDDEALHGGVGRPGTFTITGTPGITKYVWGAEPADPTNTVSTTNGAPVTIAFTPSEEGLNGIQVVGYNAVGTPSAVGALSFLVGGPTDPTGHWALAGDGTDTGTAPHALTATNVGWTSDALEVGSGAGTFNGTSSVATAAPATVDTSNSFAVSAWVRPHAITGLETAIVGQDGTDATGFHLGMRSVSGVDHWSFLMKDTSAQSSTTHAAYATAGLTSADVNRWVQLTGVFDRTSGQLRLFVNGTLAATTVSPTVPWKATGNFVIGRGTQATATPGLWFNGDVADVRLWDRVVYQSDVDKLSPVELAGRWNLFDTSGTDATAKHPLTFFNGPQVTFDEVHAVPALAFASAQVQYALSSGPAVRTDRSYTVSAWVQPQVVVRTSTTDAYMTAVSQDGANTAGVQLQFRSDGTGNVPRWCITGRSADVSSHSTNPPAPATPMACAQVLKGSTVVSPVAGTWTHLVGVYDANRAQLILYIDGVSKATTAYTATWNASGPVMIGGRKDTGVTGSRTDMWHGGIDSVEVFSGALSADQVENLYNYGDAFYTGD